MKDKKTLYVVSKISDVPYSEKLHSLPDITSGFRMTYKEDFIVVFERCSLELPLFESKRYDTEPGRDIRKRM